MTPQARIQAIIELCEETFDQTKIPADKIIHQYLRTRRYIGSADRRAIVTLFYKTMRHAPKYLRHATYQDGISINIRLLVFLFLLDQKEYSLEDLNKICDGSPYAPSKMNSSEQSVLEKCKANELTYEEWERAHVTYDLFEQLKKSLSESDTEIFTKNCLEEAPVDLRVNTIKTSRDDVLRLFSVEGIEAIPTPYSPYGIRLTKRQNLENHCLFRDGHIVVQDEGSQLIGILTDAVSGMSVLDYCAGAGGKTLLLAATMNNRGQLIATDLHDWRLQKAKERFRICGVHNARLHPLSDTKIFKRKHNSFNRVLIDVPCSGSGTWRRNPDLKIRTTTKDLEEIVQTQREILNEASKFVKKNGYLIYATCSVFAIENSDQIKWFLNEHPEYILLERYTNSRELIELHELLKTKSLTDIGISLSPYTTNTDGFYVCVLHKSDAKKLIEFNHPVNEYSSHSDITNELL